MDNGNKQYKKAVAEYQWVKENIEYRLSYWGDVPHTLSTRTGHCGIKAELLVARLKEHGIKARYVEGRPLVSNLPLLRLAPFNVHFWVEARVDGRWLTLDPTPDSGNARQIMCHDEIPVWLKELYNRPLIAPLRALSNLKPAYHRHRRPR